MIFTIPCYSNGYYHRSMTTLLPPIPSPQPLHTWQWQLGFYSKTGILIFTIPCYSNGYYHRSLTPLLPTTPSYPTLYIPGSDSWAFYSKTGIWYSQFLPTVMATKPNSSLQPHPTQPSTYLAVTVVLFILRQVFWYSQFLATVMVSITGPWPHSSLQPHPTRPLHTWQWQLCFYSKTGILIFTIPCYSNGYYHRSMTTLLPPIPSHPTLYIPGSDSWAFILRQVFWYSQFLATAMASITGPWPHSSLQPHPTRPLHTWQWQLCFYSKTGILIFTIPRYSNGFYHRSMTPLLPTTPSHPTLYIPGSDSCAFILRQVFWYSQFLATVMASITGPWPHSYLQPHPTQLSTYLAVTVGLLF